MGVTTTNNKPFNPRGNDQSPKGYNRAKLYSGKALDFDGTNDNVEVADNSSLDFTTAMSAFCYMRVDTLSTGGGVDYAISKYDYGNNNRSWLLGQRDDELIAVISKNGFSGATNTKDRFSATFENTSDYYFVGFTFESNVLKLYVNGQEVATEKTNDAEVNSIYSGNADVCVGSGQFNGSGIGFLDGKVANAKIFNTALTAAQVADLYNNPEKVVPTGVADSALKLWLPMMEGAGTTAYDGSPVGFTEDIVTGFTNGTTYPLDSFASNGDDITTAIKTNGFGGCVSNGHTYTNGQKVKVKFTYQKNSGDDLRVLFSSVVTGAGTAKSDSQNVSASGEFEHTFTMTADGVAYLQLGTGNASHSIDAVITDVYVSPNVSANHGTISGATYVNGIGAPSPQSAVMDWNKGTNILTYSEELDNSSSVFTLRSFTQNSSTETSPIGTSDAYKFTENDTNSNPALYYNGDFSDGNSQTFKMYLKADAATTFSISTQGNTEGPDINVTTEWEQYEVTQSVDTGTGPHIGGFLSIAQGSGIVLYVWHPQMSYGDSVYIPTLGTAQTSEVLLPQGLTTGRDITGVNLFENVRKQGALNLDGNSWAEVHDNESLDITSAITLEAWVYWDTSDTIASGVFGKWTASNQCYLLYKTNAGDGIRFYINSNAVGAGSLTDGWHHIVGTYDRTNKRLYVDGAQVNLNNQADAIATSSLPLEIGRYDQQSSYGYEDPIAQPRIYNRALTAAEIQQNYNAGKNTYTN